MTTWRDLIPEDDQRIYEQAGFGREQGIGERPAVLVIDVTRGFVGSPGLDREQAAAEYRNSCGPAAWRALPAVQGLLELGRARGLPIFYTKGRSLTNVAALGRWATKNARAQEDLRRGADVHHIVDEVAPAEGDVVIEKEKPSAFFGTNLLSALVQAKVDGLLVAGTTTSGCVRASVVDAFSYNFAVTVVEDAVFDRGVLPHAVNLFDMQAKYAQVIALEQVRAQLSA